jgi:hypothetical protein
MPSFKPNFTWQNMHQTEPPVTSDRFYTPRNLNPDGSRDLTNTWRPGFNALRQIVADAEGANKRVRALGGLWSLSPIALLKDYVIDTTNLTECITDLPPGAFVGSPIANRQFAFVQAGSRIVELHEDLMAAGLDLPTSGASNGQTLAGAISTGTHGAAIDVGAMQDYVVGLHLIGAAGRHAWIERKSRPIASDAFVQLLGAELIRDDDMFNAAVVSFGSFGIVHAYMLEVEQAFMLEQYVKRVDLAAALACVANADIDATSLGLPPGSARPFHFEFVVDPYHRGSGESGAFARVMYKVPFGAQTAAAGGIISTPTPAILGEIGSLLNSLPAVIDRAAIKLALPPFLAQQVPPTWGAIATPAVVFGDTTLRTGGVSMELAFELSDVPQAAAILGETAEDNLYTGVLAFRFVRASRATMAFTRGPRGDTLPPDRIVCTVETDALNSNGTTAAMKAFWSSLDAAGVPYTLHWGQALRQDAAWVRDAYGVAADEWRAKRREWLSTPQAQRLFSSDIIDALGLST